MQLKPGRQITKESVNLFNCIFQYCYPTKFGMQSKFLRKLYVDSALWY